MKVSRFAVLSFVFLLLAGFSVSAFAQNQGRNRGQGNNQGNNQGGQRGNFDPAQMRERYMTQLKEQLGSTDEEWKALSPKVEKVLNAQRDNRRGGGGNRGPGRTRGSDTNNTNQNNNPPQQLSEVSNAAEELRKTVADKGSTPEDITKKLTALREAREKAKNELTGAQKELRELLSARQEAILVTNGILD
jgi:chromosome segregation ATPase